MDAQGLALQHAQTAHHIEVGVVQTGEVLHDLLVHSFQTHGDQAGGDLVAHLLQLLADAGVGQGVSHDLGLSYIGALAGNAEQQSLLHQLGDNVAHGGAADAIDMAQLVFRGDQPAGRPLSGFQLLEDGFLDLNVQRFGIGFVKSEHRSTVHSVVSSKRMIKAQFLSKMTKREK